MNYQDRINMIGVALKPLLARYKRPEHMDAETARLELVDMVEDLNHNWPDFRDQDAFDLTFAGFTRSLRAIQNSRSWPSIATMLKALDASRQSKGSVTPEAAAEAIFGMVVDWWHQFHDAMPSTATEAHAERMIVEGIASPGELRRGGFRLTGDRYEKAMADHDPDHPRLLADIIAMGEQLRENRAPQGNVVSSMPIKQWADGAAPGDPRWEMLRQARIKAGAIPAEHADFR